MAKRRSCFRIKTTSLFQRFDLGGWINLIDNLVTFGNQPYDSVVSMSSFMAVKLDESLKERIKTHGL